MNIAPVFGSEVVCQTAVRTCRSCGSSHLQSFVDLGVTPLCESFLRSDQLDSMEPFFPLHARVCGACFLVQLDEFVSPEHIFTEYAYFSSFSTSWVEHCKRYTDMITARLKLGANSLAMELASNDGYLLQHFLPLGVPVLGIEPAANVAKVAIAKGIPTRVEFFGTALAAQLVQEDRQADLIIGNNVLAQIPDLNDFVAGMVLVLKPDGVITLEFPHLERLIEGNQFDTIYHEHFSYFSLSTIDRLMTSHALKLIDVEELPSHGGSLRVYIAHATAHHAVAPSVQSLLEREVRLGFNHLAAYSAFTSRVHRLKRQLLSFLSAAKDEGKTICGYGAPGKGNTLLNYCGIGPEFLDFTVDRNPYKHGRFTPGRRIPIHPVDKIDEVKPDYILILPWNLRTEIMQQMQHVGDWGAKFILPVPELAIIDPKEIKS